VLGRDYPLNVTVLSVQGGQYEKLSF
jgi:hypothetical protein